MYKNNLSDYAKIPTCCLAPPKKSKYIQIQASTCKVNLKLIISINYTKLVHFLDIFRQILDALPTEPSIKGTGNVTFTEISV